jgi:hypothetical protein
VVERPRAGDGRACALDVAFFGRRNLAVIALEPRRVCRIVRSHMADHDESIDEGEIEDLEDDGRRRVPAELYSSIPAGQLPAMGRDGAPTAGQPGPPAPLPPATTANFICLRGPCRHYWQTTTHIESGNPKATWDPRDGLRPSKPCPACAGAGAQLVAPLTATDHDQRCNYVPTQGCWLDRPCLLEMHHDGAHHHDAERAPAPRPIACETCNGTGVVPDRSAPVVKEPRQISRLCLVHPGVETDLSENLVYDCNRWDPILPKEAHALDKRRRVYLKIHPEHQ